MTLTQSLLVIALLIAMSAFFSLAEIALAASRRLRLRQMADDGDARADLVLRIQEQPGYYFTVVQIGLNAVAILGGVVGEGALSPYFARLFTGWLGPEGAQSAGFLCSFVTIIAVFLVFADLFPKRLGMNDPERLAVRIAKPMQLLITTFKPLVWLFTACTDLLFKLLGMPMARDDKITSADILDRGRRAGRRARRARAAGDRQRVRARDAAREQRDDRARQHRLVPARRPRVGAARAHRGRALLGLPGVRRRHRPRAGLRRRQGHVPARAQRPAEIGRASCRERV